MTVKIDYLMEGATIRPIMINRHRLRLWPGGTSKICFRKKVLSSVICQNITNWQTAAKRMYDEWGSNQRTYVQLSGVNWRTARLILPDVEWISLMDSHLYSRISRYWHSFMPIHIPSPLQSKISRMIASHQHSTKFGSKWANAIYKNSCVTTIPEVNSGSDTNLSNFPHNTDCP